VNVLGISSSPRRHGNTELLLDEVLRGAQDAGGTVEKIVLTDVKIAPCRECERCVDLGRCVIQDDMQTVYTKLLDTDRLAFASPIFFMALCAQAKALVDRCQALWIKKYVRKEPILPPGRTPARKGLFVSVGGTRGEKLFNCPRLTMKYFFDVLEMEYAGDLTFRRIDATGEICNHPTAMKEAYDVGKRLVTGEAIARNE
jgi:multimeric flavodoxin WrbA